MEKANKEAIKLLLEIRNEMESPDSDPATSKIIVAGRLGPRYEGYYPDKHPKMTPSEAEEYHSQQINWFAETEADMVSHSDYLNTCLLILATWDVNYDSAFLVH